MKARNHGMSSTPEYTAWQAMKNRCSNPNHVQYADYGARGIKVCRRWANSFKGFYADVGARPSRDHMLTRLNTDGDYEPRNCQWATRPGINKFRRGGRMKTKNAG